MDSKPRILVVDDDELTAESYAARLEESGLDNTSICIDSRKVLGEMGTRPTDLVLLDLNMPHIGGLELLEKITERYPGVDVIVITAVDRVDTAVQCMKRGAFDFLSKPVESNRLVTAVRHSLQIRSLRNELYSLSDRFEQANVSNPDAFAEIISTSSKMQAVFAYIEAIAVSPKSALIVGESGTGKELVARAIHRVSGRSGAFVPVNVSGLDDTMFSDTLFGHSRGAYTGADRAREGLIAQAAGGTLFLDEIGDLGLSSQMKLLRLLQEEEYYPLGSDAPKKAKVRIVAATNADLVARQEDGSFRRDLYYRLMAHTVRLPPLRERGADLRVLSEHFLSDACRSMGRETLRIPNELFEVLEQYSFPGNVRELQSLIFDAVSVSSENELSIQYFEDALGLRRPDRPIGGKFNVDVSTVPDSNEVDSVGVVDGPIGDDQGAFGPVRIVNDFPKLSEVESYLIDEALRRCDGNQTAAAALLGVSQSTLSRRNRRRE